MRIRSSARPSPIDPRQPHRPAVDQRHAPAAAEDAEHRVLLDDAQVAPQRQLQPAGDGVAGDRGDHRLAQQHPRGAHRPVAVGRDAVALGASPAAFRFAPAQNVPPAPHSTPTRASSSASNARNASASASAVGAVDRVADLRLVEDHRRDGTVALDRDCHAREASDPPRRAVPRVADLTMKIAIVGAGVSGLVAAHVLHRAHDVTLFEASDYAGGHTHTVRVETDGGAWDVDTGFIVHNDRNYPQLPAAAARARRRHAADRT